MWPIAMESKKSLSKDVKSFDTKKTKKKISNINQKKPKPKKENRV